MLYGVMTDARASSAPQPEQVGIVPRGFLSTHYVAAANTRAAEAKAVERTRRIACSHGLWREFEVVISEVWRASLWQYLMRRTLKGVTFYMEE